MTDVRQALLDPTAVYSDPADVLADASLSRDHKIEILRRWAYDARELEVAEEEAGMPLKRPEMYSLVMDALHSLGVGPDVEHTPPTK